MKKLSKKAKAVIGAWIQAEMIIFAAASLVATTITLYKLGSAIVPFDVIPLGVNLVIGFNIGLVIVALFMIVWNKVDQWSKT
jgi:uncharacterized membrane protein YczE